jgi:UDP-glucuronate 4-epimerase
MKTMFVTGAAGFIGYHVARTMLDLGRSVVGFDNVNSYYDPALKRGRLGQLEGRPGWRFIEGDLRDADGLRRAVAEADADCVVHMAAQAGVRWSIERPEAYVDSNLVGFANVLEACRHEGIAHLVYASSSSVYGANTKTPFAVGDNVDHPVSLYAATKKANELMAHAYSHLFGLPTTGLRFFTVYGPWGRPDMAYWKFTDAILSGKPIDVFGGGVLKRDFTYIDDVVEAIGRICGHAARGNPTWSGDAPDPATSSAPWRIYNIGNHTPVTVNDMIALLEQLCGRRAIRVEKPRQPGDVEVTYADVEALSRDFQFEPKTPLATGLARFVDWFRSWHSSYQTGRGLVDREPTRRQ